MLRPGQRGVHPVLEVALISAVVNEVEVTGLGNLAAVEELLRPVEAKVLRELELLHHHALADVVDNNVFAVPARDDALPIGRVCEAVEGLPGRAVSRRDPVVRLPTAGDVFTAVDEVGLLAEVDVEEHHLPIETGSSELFAVRAKRDGEYIRTQLKGFDSMRASEDGPYANALIPGATRVC